MTVLRIVPRGIGIYLLLVAALGVIGFGLGAVSAPGDLVLVGAGLTVAAFSLISVAGWKLLRTRPAAVIWGIASQLPQLVEVASDGRLYRVVMGLYWAIPISGEPPHSSLGFLVSES